MKSNLRTRLQMPAASLATIASVMTMTAAWGTPALAVTASESNDFSIEEVLVTATRRETSVLKVPYNISAVTGLSIEAAQITDKAELMRNVPGVSVVDRGYRNSGVITGINIRGVNVDGGALGDYAVLAVPTVSTYVNDTPLFANFLLKDLNRVEVLRGPQGTLYGSGSLGGTVRYIMNDPKLGEFSGKASGGLSQTKGSSSVGWTGDLTLNIPLGETMALRVTGSRVYYPGITDYVNLYQLDSAGAPVAPNGVLDPAAAYTSKKDADTVKIWYGRAALMWKASDAVNIKISYAHQEDKTGGRRQMTVGQDGYGRTYNDYENGSIQLEPSSRKVDLGSLEANIDLGFATLTSSTSYYDHHGESISENTGFYAHAGFMAYYYNYPRPMASAVRGYGDKSFVQEVRLASVKNEKLDYVVGAYYQDQTLDSSQDSYLRGFKVWWDTWLPEYASAVTGDSDFYYRRHEKYKDRAAFGELTFHATDKLDITGGMRYFDNSSDATTSMNLPLYASLNDLNTKSFKVSENKALFKGNISWKYAENGLGYATISQGYRRGGANAVPTTGFFAENVAWQTYKSDSVVNYEAGIKGRFDKMQYNASVFYIDWKDIQINTSTPNWGFFAAQNGGKARSMGVELELDGRLTREVHYNLGYTYTNAKLRNDVCAPYVAAGSCTPVNAIALDGTRLPGTPEHMFNIGVDYTYEMQNGITWTSRIGGYYQSKTQNAINKSLRYAATLPAFSLWNISTAFGYKDVNVTLYMKNVFNNKGVTGLYTEAHMGTDPSVGYYGNANKQMITLPRTIGMSFDYNF
jgi:outer membrane receptor protein involved in Fe transport